MKPSKTLSILTLVAAIIGGGGYALILSQQDKAVVGDRTVAQATATPTTAASTATPTATPTVSTDLKKEIEVFDTEFDSVTEADFDAGSLDNL